MRTVRLSQAFPRRALTGELLTLIDTVKKLGLAQNGEKQAVQEDFKTPKDAVRAANALRNYVKNHQEDICVAYSKGSLTITLYTGKPKKRANTTANNTPADSGGNV